MLFRENVLIRLMRLSQRLEQVFKCLNPRQNVWDFCCDHGYLGAEAYKSQNFGDIYFVDQVDTIIEHLKNRFQKYSYSEANPSKAHFLCQSGESINVDVTGTVCITGVGGTTIFQILSGLSVNGRLHADRLILGPHKDNDKLLKLLSEYEYLKKYKLSHQNAITENDRIRHLFVFDRVSHIGQE
jgi:tRNA (adenine22-N1)-methyltransferase